MLPERDAHPSSAPNCVMTNPYQPGWRPSYSGPNASLGDVGSGGDFGVDLEKLYYAGRQRLPMVSVQYAEMTEDVHQTQTYSRGEFTRPDGGVHPAHALWMELRDELQDFLRAASTNFWDTGEALVSIANLYVATDEEAAAAFATALAGRENNPGFPITDLPPEPDPPAPDDHTPLPPPPGEEERAPVLPPPPGEDAGDDGRSSRELPAWDEE